MKPEVMATMKNKWPRILNHKISKEKRPHINSHILQLSELKIKENGQNDICKPSVIVDWYALMMIKTLYEMQCFYPPIWEWCLTFSHKRSHGQ